MLGPGRVNNPRALLPCGTDNHGIAIMALYDQARREPSAELKLLSRGLAAPDLDLIKQA
jgi:hypothetical protein